MSLSSFLPRLIASMYSMQIMTLAECNLYVDANTCRRAALVGFLQAVLAVNFTILHEFINEHPTWNRCSSLLTGMSRLPVRHVVQAPCDKSYLQKMGTNAKQREKCP